MEGKYIEMLKANLLSGLLPAVFSPLLWPFVVLFSEGHFPSWETYPNAALSISFFALLIGLCACLVLGFPSLMVLDRLDLNKPIIASIAGLILAIMLFLIITAGGKDATLSNLWTILIFFALLGAVCGAAASILSRTNKALKTDSKSTI